MPTVSALVRDTVGMPRRFPQPPGADAWVAERVSYERNKLGLTMGELARRMTDAGAPVKQQTIGQIEKGTPPRKVSLGEAIALCQVFGIADVAELGRPPGDVLQSDLARFGEQARDVMANTAQLVNTEKAMVRNAVALIKAADRALVRGSVIDEVADIAESLITTVAQAFQEDADKLRAAIWEARNASQDDA